MLPALLFIAVVAAILFGILTSAMCGAISAYCNVPPFIVTLATMRIFRSLAQYFFTGGGIQVRGDVDKYLIISDIKVFGVIPIIIIYWLILTVIVAVFSKKTAVGRHIFAVGSNEKGNHALRHQYGTSPKNAVAFGDNDNDMDMLKCVGTGILMGNARNDLKERIPYVTCDNDSDGIYHALAEMGIL